MFSKHKAACRTFFAAGKGEEFVTLTDAVHCGWFSPTGGGKTAGGLIPFLLTVPETCVVHDPSGGDIYRATVKARKKMGRVICLDHSNLVGGRDSLNPLTSIRLDDNGPDDIKVFADSLVVPDPNAKEGKHWDDLARLFIAMMTGFIVRGGNPALVNPESLCHMLANPEDIQGACDILVKDQEWNGTLARWAYMTGNCVDRERGSALTTTNRHLNFFSSPNVMRACMTSSFDPNDLPRSKCMTVYVMANPNQLSSHAGLIRMWFSTLFRACVSAGTQGARRVHFLCDEAYTFRSMACIEDALNYGRKFNIRLQLFYQGIDQLKECFPNDQHTVALGNMTQIFMGVQDLTTAEYVSKRLGQLTAYSTGSSRSYSDNTSVDYQGHTTRSTGWNETTNTQETARPLMFADEVIALDKRTALTFSPGLPAIMSRVVYWFEKEFQQYYRKRWIARQLELRCIGAGVMAVLTLLLMAAITWQLASKPPIRSPPEQTKGITQTRKDKR